MKETYNYPLVDSHSDYPLVFATFTSKSGVNVGGAFLIDTASQHNILNPQILDIIEAAPMDDNKEIALTSFRGESVSAGKTNFDFLIEKDVFKESFYISPKISFDSVYEGHVVVGVLGVDFMIKHGLALDFSKAALRSSGQNVVNGDCYTFPLQFGLSQYGLPIVVMTSENKDFVCLVDSGSCFNIMTNRALNCAEMPYQCIKRGETFKSITCLVDADVIRTCIELTGIDPNSKKYSKHLFSETFHVTKDDWNIIDGEDGIPPISVILGANFLKKHKCVIDFGNDFFNAY